MTAELADGLILFAHGARDPAWARPFERVLQGVRAQRPGLPVRLAFLELMAPDLAGAGAELAREGCRNVAVVPLFLGAGGHVRRDLPERIAALAEALPEVRWQLHEPIGEVPAVLQAITEAAVAALLPPAGSVAAPSPIQPTQGAAR